MAKIARHMLDDVADELVQWLNGEAEWYADALRAGGPSPFRADVTEDEKLKYYQEHLFMTNPDGSVNWDAPNEKEREALLVRVGQKGYTDVMRAVLASKPTAALVDVPKPTSSVGTYELPE